MAIDETTTRHPPTSSRSIRGWVIRALAVLLVAATATFIVGGNEVAEPDTPVSESISREDLMRDWVNRGLVPSQALEPAAISREDLMRDWVNRGLIPSQALDGNE